MSVVSESQNVCPKVRTADLVIEDMADEIVVYDRQNKAAHLLSGATAKLWRLCDGTRSTADLVTALDGDDASQDAVDEALAELDAIGLLEWQKGADIGDAPAGVSRRAILTQAAGAATFAGSTIVTLQVPLAQSVISATCTSATSAGLANCVAACPSAADAFNGDCRCTDTADFSCDPNSIPNVCIHNSSIIDGSCGCSDFDTPPGSC